MIKKLTEEKKWTQKEHIYFFTESDFFVNFQFSSIVCFFGRFFFPCQILNKFFLLHCQLRSPVFLTLSDYIFCVIPLVYSICMYSIAGDFSVLAARLTFHADGSFVFMSL